MTHPLTDDICDSLIKEFVGFDPDDMRTAADWQLAQCLQFVLLNYGPEAMVPFMEAMRPTQER